jgi:phosphatidylinositol phospholipase C gamma-1
MDLRNTVKNGILYLQDPVDKEWNPHFFVLTHNKLFYTDIFHENQRGEGDEEEEEETEPTVQRSREVIIVSSRKWCKHLKITSKKKNLIS